MTDVTITFSNRENNSKQPLKLKITGLSDDKDSSRIAKPTKFQSDVPILKYNGGEFQASDFLYSKIDEIRKYDGNDSDLTLEDFKKYYENQKSNGSVIYDEERNFVAIMNKNNKDEYLSLSLDYDTEKELKAKKVSEFCDKYQIPFKDMIIKIFCS